MLLLRAVEVLPERPPATTESSRRLVERAGEAALARPSRAMLRSSPTPASITIRLEFP